jgi:hypothetical protein
VCGAADLIFGNLVIGNFVPSDYDVYKVWTYSRSDADQFREETHYELIYTGRPPNRYVLPWYERLTFTPKATDVAACYRITNRLTGPMTRSANNVCASGEVWSGGRIVRTDRYQWAP